MTEKASPEWFTCPGLEEGGRVAVQLADGTLAEGYWYGGQLHDNPREPMAEPSGHAYNPHHWPFREGFGDWPTSPYTLASVPAFRIAMKLDAPFWPNRPPAPWRIWPVNREWRIEKRVGDGYETWCRFDTSTEAFAAFAAGGSR